MAAMSMFGCVERKAPSTTSPGDLVLAPGYEDLDAELEVMRARAGVPALAAVVFDGDEVLAMGAVGRRRIDESAKVELDDAFHLGSTAKPMTAFVLARLVDQGVVQWHTPLHELLPDFASIMHPAYRGVPVELLFRHRAGLPIVVPGITLRADVLGSESDRLGQRRRIAAASLIAAPLVPPGQKFVYTNVGYVVAGVAMEKRTGKTWEALMQAEVFDLLGMDSCGFGPTATGRQRDQPWAHARIYGKYSPTDRDVPSSRGPAGRVHCSLLDWAKFVRANLLRTAVLQADTWARLHAPTPIEGRGYGYAMGWTVTLLPWADGAVLAHSGSNSVNYAAVWILPTEGFAVLGVSNAGDIVAARAVEQVVVGLARRYAAARG